MSPRHGRWLVARLDSLGDVLLAGGAIRAVSGQARHVTLLTGSAGAAAAPLLPGVADVDVFEAAWVPIEPRPLDPATVDTFIRRTATAAYDGALIFTSYHQSPLPLALLLRMAGVPWIGAISDDYPGALLDLRHRVPDDLPEAERNLSLAVAAGFPPDAAGAALAVRRPLVPRPDWLPDDPYVVVHPGAAVPARRPSGSTTRRFVAALRAAGWPVVVTGSAAEAPLVAQVAVDGAVDAAGRLGLDALASVLAGAEVVVTGNTGPAHLAAAVGVPIVSLFAPVVPAARWAPYGVPTVLLGDQSAPCHDTRARECPVPGHPCLDAISPELVVEAVECLASRSPLTLGGHR